MNIDSSEEQREAQHLLTYFKDLQKQSVSWDVIADLPKTATMLTTLNEREEYLAQRWNELLHQGNRPQALKLLAIAQIYQHARRTVMALQRGPQPLQTGVSSQGDDIARRAASRVVAGASTEALWMLAELPESTSRNVWDTFFDVLKKNWKTAKPDSPLRMMIISSVVTLLIVALVFGVLLSQGWISLGGVAASPTAAATDVPGAVAAMPTQLPVATRVETSSPLATVSLTETPVPLTPASSLSDALDENARIEPSTVALHKLATQVFTITLNDSTPLVQPEGITFNADSEQEVSLATTIDHPYQLRVQLTPQELTTLETLVSTKKQVQLTLFVENTKTSIDIMLSIEEWEINRTFIKDNETDYVGDNQVKLWQDMNQEEMIEGNNAGRIAALSNGNKIAILREQGEYYYVRVITGDSDSINKDGWVKKKYIDGQ